MPENRQVSALLGLAPAFRPEHMETLREGLAYKQMCATLACLCTVRCAAIAERLRQLAADTPQASLADCYEAAKEQLMRGDEAGWAARVILGKGSDHASD